MHIHERRPCETDPQYGCEPGRRSLAELVRLGVILLDKPSGPTSRQAAERAAGLAGAVKVGHGGVLDPKVTGVLPLLLEKAVKAQQVLSGLSKAYQGVMRIHGEVPDDELEGALSAFRGQIVQVPPLRSRVKRRPRQRTVFCFEVLSRDGRNAEFAAECEAGTYIRKLVHDLGEHLGCGAHMLKLRRTRSGPFTQDECTTLEDLEEVARQLTEGNEQPLRKVVRPVEDVLGRIVPRLWVDDLAVNSLCEGYPLAVPGVARLEEFEGGRQVAVLTAKGELVALGKSCMSCEQILAEQKGIAVRSHEVFMEPGTYPAWKGKSRHGHSTAETSSPQRNMQ